MIVLRGKTGKCGKRCRAEYDVKWEISINTNLEVGSRKSEVGNFAEGVPSGENRK